MRQFVRQVCRGVGKKYKVTSQIWGEQKKTFTLVNVEEDPMTPG